MYNSLGTKLIWLWIGTPMELQVCIPEITLRRCSNLAPTDFADDFVKACQSGADGKSKNIEEG